MNDGDSPYAAPRARQVLAVAEDPEAVPTHYVRHDVPARCPASAGTAWLRDGWALFRLRPGLQTGIFWLMTLLGALTGLLSFIPFAATVTGWTLQTLFMAGLVRCLQAIERGEPIGIERFFSAFSHPRRSALLMLGLAMSGFSLLNGWLAAQVAGDPALFLDMEGVSGSGALDRMYEDAGMTFRYFSSMVLFGMLAYSLTSYAVMLVLDHDMNPGRALWVSVQAIFMNVLPITVNSLWVFLLLAASGLTLFLGCIMLFPVLMAVWWVSYRRIFTTGLSPDEPTENPA